MTFSKLFLTALCCAPAVLMGQGGGVTPDELLKPLKDSWPTYNGDYSGKRFSALTQVDRTTVKHLTLAWMTQVHAGTDDPQESGGRRRRREAPKLIVGGEGAGDLAIRGGTIKASALEVDGMLYFTMPDNAWAVDARDGTRVMALLLEDQGRHAHRQPRVRYVEHYLFMETPDDYLVSLDARTGKERWHKVIADLDQQYFSTPAPIVVGNHVLVGTGNDHRSRRASSQSFDPETGELQWKFYTGSDEKGRSGDWTRGRVWMRPGTAAGRRWVPGAYDPETKLYIFGTGNPTPAFTKGTRGEGDNLFTCTLDRRERGYRKDGLVLPDVAA